MRVFLRAGRCWLWVALLGLATFPVLAEPLPQVAPPPLVDEQTLPAENSPSETQGSSVIGQGLPLDSTTSEFSYIPQNTELENAVEEEATPEKPSMAELPFNLFVPEVSRKPFRLSVRVLNKRTNEVVDYDVSPGITIPHEGIFISAKRCVEKNTDQNEAAWIEMADKSGGKIFAGWMYAEFPEFNPVLHAVYEVRLTKCLPVKK